MPLDLLRGRGTIAWETDGLFYVRARGWWLVKKESSKRGIPWFQETIHNLVTGVVKGLTGARAVSWHFLQVGLNYKILSKGLL